MARSYTYDRPLDAKILPRADNSNHEFRFFPLLEIKKEVENETFDAESDPTTEALVCDSNSIDSDHQLESQSANVHQHRYNETNKSHPKLLIKFRDLLKNSRRTDGSTRKRKKSECEGLQSEILKACDPRSNKRYKSELSNLSEERVTRSSTSMPKPLAPREKKIEGNSSEEKTGSDKKKNQDTWDFGRITRSNPNKNFKCESCGMCFANKRHLRSHKRYYTPNVDLQCTICDIGFSRDVQLARHIRKAHSTIESDHAYRFKCHLCTDRFERKTHLIAHVAHLHNKHLVSQKTNENPDRESSLSDIRSREKRRKGSTRRSKRNVKHTVQVNHNNLEIESYGQSDSTTDLKLSAEDQCNVEEYSTHENLGVQVKNNHPILDKPEPDEATARQVIPSPIYVSIEKSIESTNVQEIVQEDVSAFKTQDSEIPRVLQSLPELSEEENQVHRSQISSEVASQNVQPQLGGNLVDHLGNPAGSWCIFEPPDQPNKTGNISGTCSRLATTDRNDTSSKKGMASRIQCTSSNVFQTTALESSTVSDVDSTTHLDKMLGAEEETSTHVKSTSGTKHNQTPNKVDPNQGSEIRKLGAHHQSERLVGIVLSHQVADDETVRENVTTSNLSVDCNDVGSDLVQVDDFGGIPESALMDCEDKDKSDNSFESGSHKIGTSSLSNSATDLTGLEFQSTTAVTNCDTLSDLRIKDVRVLLVKLENMLDLSKKNNTPKSSSLGTCSSIKTDISDVHPYKKILPNLIELRQYSNRKHNSGKIRHIKESRSGTQKNCKTTDDCPSVFLDYNALQNHDEMKESKFSRNRCYFCKEVFRNNFSATSHYLSLHTEIGVFQCCLCYEPFKNLRSLRNHLYRNHNACAQKRTIRCCLVCKEKLSNPSSSQRCLKCDRFPEFRNSGSRREQFLDTQDLTEKNSAHTLTSGKFETSGNVFMSSLTKLHRVSVPSGKEESHIVASVNNRESANTDANYSLVEPCKEGFKNFKCSACDRVFFHSRQLTEHLTTVHADVEYSNLETRQNVVEPQIPEYSASLSGSKKRKNRCKGKKNAPKFSVGKKRKLKYNEINNHDKSCKKNLSIRQKLKLSQANGSQRSNQQCKKRSDTKTCYAYKCHVCGLNCCCRKNLKTHKTRYLTTGNNVCNTCGLIFAWKHVLVTHMKTAHNPKVVFHGRIRCEVCNQGFYNKKFLRIHLAHFHKMKYFQCRDCRIRFDTRRSLNIHRKYYSENVSYHCSICDQAFKCKYLVEYHTAQAHNQDKLKAYKYSCDTCSFSFIDELLLQAHIGHFHNAQSDTAQTRKIRENVRGSPSPPESAEDIELTVKSGEVHVHPSVKTNNTTILEKNENHKTQEKTADAVSQPGRRNTPSEYKCNICKLSFTEPHDILNHEWEFSNEGIYACNVCNRKFMTDSHRKNHRIKHYERTVGANHKCYVCKEDFSKVDHLKMHGLHLHGPQFDWEKGSETTDENKSNESHSRTEHAREVDLKKLPLDRTHDTLELMTSNKGSQNSRILLFQKVVNLRSSMELQRPHSNEELYCCDFCETNFNSESLLKYHITNHAYHAYHCDSSRYLCLICKNKFRTNDVLRAHVIHCHTSNKDANNLNLSDAACLKFDANTHVEQVGSTYNETVNVAQMLPITQANQNQPSTHENRNRLLVSKSTAPSKKVQLSNTSRNKGGLGNDHSYFAPFSHGIECDTVNDLGPYNSSKCSTVKTIDSNNSDSSPGEVEVFIIKVKDLGGSEKYACSICLDVFHSIAQFREHFAEDHVRNGAYRCTLCGKKFSLISALKDHTVKHKPSNFVCCGKKFKQAADFICHRFLHESHTKERGNGSKKQGSPGGNAAAYLDESDDESNDTRSENSWKCEICDEVFLDIDVMLKHWDVCINTNGLQCDMCRAMFKNSNSLKVHKMTYHKNRHQNRSKVHNRSKLPENSTRTTQTAARTRPVTDNQPENKGSTSYSEKPHTVHKMAKVLASTDKFAKENEIIRYEKILGKPIAKILHNSQNQIEGCDDEPNAENNTASTTKVNPELTKAHGVCISSEHDPLKISHQRISVKHLGKKICLKLKGGPSKQTNPQIRKPNAPVLKKNPCSTNQNSLLNYFAVQDSRNAHKPQSVQNDFGIRFKQNKSKEKRLTSQRQTPTTVKNMASVPSAAHNSKNIQDGNVASIDFGRKSLSTNHNDMRSSKLPTASSNTPSDVVYYLRIPPVIDSPNTTENVMIIPSDPNQKPDSTNCSDKILSALVPIYLNTPISSNFVVNIPPVSENSCNSSNQTIDSDSVDLESNSNDHARKKLPHFLAKSSSIVLNPVCVFDNNRIADEVHSNRHANDSGIRSPSNDDKGVIVPLPPATSGTSTQSVLLASNENVTKGLHSPPSISASKIDLIQKNHSVRCNYCNLSFTEKSKLKEHMNSHKTDNQCPACGLNFSNGRALEQHLPEHQCSTCTKCKMVFFFSDSIAYPAGTQKYCSSCNSLLPSPTRRNNRTRNSGRQIMKCGICMDAFGTISEMTVHFKQVHSSFVCGICESKFSMKTTLLSHMQTHGNASPETAQCKTCNKYFNEKIELAYHELSH